MFVGLFAGVTCIIKFDCAVLMTVREAHPVGYFPYLTVVSTSVEFIFFEQPKKTEPKEKLPERFLI